jgi:xanthine/CO dehydrogenase XdhC/CoxF family maturation factor
VSEDAIGRLHGPVGLDLGPTNRAEIALAIFAEILSPAVRALGTVAARR